MANAVLSYYYDAFGASTNVKHDPTNKKQFTGKETDEDSGLQYFIARYYDPEVGRFLSLDPVPNGNLYVYCDSNPINKVDPDGREAEPKWEPPVTNKKAVITGEYGIRRDPITGKAGSMHKGVDIGAQKGVEIKAMAEGMVIWAGKLAGYGNAVIVKMEGTYATLSGHADKIIAKKGDKVNAGDVLATIGSTGRSTGPHLHQELWENGKRIMTPSFRSAIGSGVQVSLASMRKDYSSEARIN